MNNRFRILALAVALLLGTCGLQAESNTNALKLTFLSWGSGSTKLSYERAFPSVGQSGEVCVGLIGAGYDKFDNDPSGVTVRYGHKFFLEGYSPERPLQGFYVRPEAIYTRFHHNALSGERTLAEMVALIGTAGYQHCFGRWIVDGWVGAGYCTGTPADTGYHHGFILLDSFGLRSDHIALSFSIRVGWTF